MNNKKKARKPNKHIEFCITSKNNEENREGTKEERPKRFKLITDFQFSDDSLNEIYNRSLELTQQYFDFVCVPSLENNTTQEILLYQNAYGSYNGIRIPTSNPEFNQWKRIKYNNLGCLCILHLYYTGEIIPSFSGRRIIPFNSRRKELFIKAISHFSVSIRVDLRSSDTKSWSNLQNAYLLGEKKNRANLCKYTSRIIQIISRIEFFGIKRIFFTLENPGSLFEGSNPSNPFEIGEYYFNQCLYEKAIKSFEEISQSPTSSHQDKVKSLEYQGFSYYELGKWQEAVKKIKQIGNLSDGSQLSDASQFGLALAQESAFQFNDALLSFQKLIQYYPESPQLNLGVGRIHFKLREYGEAISKINSIIRFYDREYEIIGRQISSKNLFSVKAKLDNLLENTKFNEFVETNSFKSNYESPSCKLHYSDLYYFIGKISQAIGENSAIYSERNQYFKVADEAFKQVISYTKERGLYEKQLLAIEALISLLKLRSDKAFDFSYKSSKALQNKGEEILAGLLSETPCRKKQLHLFLKFSFFINIRIDQLAQSSLESDTKQAFIYAEIAKNLYLEYITYQAGKSSPSSLEINYENIIESIPDEKTAIIHWHVSHVSITTFIVSKESFWICRKADNRLINKVKLYLASKSQIRGFYFSRTINDLYSFESWIRQWKEDYFDFKKEPNMYHLWVLKMNSQLRKLRMLIRIESIRKYLSRFDHVILMPHQDLYGLPIHAFFLDKFTYRYLPSTSFLKGEIFAKDERHTKLDYGFLFVGEHEKEMDTVLYEKNLLKKLYGNHFKSLHSSEITCQTLINSFATAKSIPKSSEFPEEFFLHFSGHAEHDFNEPERSRLHLHNDYLTVSNILENSSGFEKCKLVSLSACETAISSSQYLIQEYIGLSSAFLVSGCSYVIGTLWIVPEIPTSLFFMKFYSIVKNYTYARNYESENITNAFRDTQVWLSQLDWESLEVFLSEHSEVFLKFPSFRNDLKNDFKKVVDEDNNYLEAINLNLIFSSTGSLIFDLTHIPQKENKPYSNPFYWAGFIITAKN